MTEQNQSLPAVVVQPTAQTALKQIEAEAEQRVAVMDRIHTLLQKRIDPKRDIALLGGKFRRTVNFARCCRRVLGGDITYRRNPQTDLPYKRIDYQDDAGTYYVYVCVCEWHLPWGEVVEGIGTVSSRDPFFGVEDDEYKEQSDVNEAHIAAKSVTEAFKAAIFTGLGFPKDVTQEELNRYGIDGGQASGHNFDAAKGNRGGSTDTSQDSKDARSSIEAGCRKLLAAGYKLPSGAEATTPEEVLQAVTANPEKGWQGWRTFRAIKDTQLERIAAQVDSLVKSSGGDDGLDKLM